MWGHWIMSCIKRIRQKKRRNCLSGRSWFLSLTSKSTLHFLWPAHHWFPQHQFYLLAFPSYLLNAFTSQRTALNKWFTSWNLAQLKAVIWRRDIIFQCAQPFSKHKNSFKTHIHSLPLTLSLERPQQQLIGCCITRFLWLFPLSVRKIQTLITAALIYRMFLTPAIYQKVM